MERNNKRLKSLQNVRPAFMDEFEKLEGDLKKMYEVYMEKFRNLTYLEQIVDAYDRQQQVKVEVNIVEYPAPPWVCSKIKGYPIIQWGRPKLLSYLIIKRGGGGGAPKYTAFLLLSWFTLKYTAILLLRGGGGPKYTAFLSLSWFTLKYTAILLLRGAPQNIQLSYH